MIGPVVIKVGGSLLNWPGLPERLSSFLASLPNPRRVLITGGGRATDAVRELDHAHRLGDEIAHRLALRSLDLTAHLLVAIQPRSRVVESWDHLTDCWDDGLLPILAPRRFLEEVDSQHSAPLPASWDVTSDSIAARLAIFLKASELVLLKSASLPSGSDRHAAARLGFVDPVFPNEIGRLPRVSYVNLRDPHAVSTSF